VTSLPQDQRQNGGSVRAGADQRLLRAVTRFWARCRPDRRPCGWRGDYRARRLRTDHRLGCGPSARALVDARTVFCLRELEAITAPPAVARGSSAASYGLRPGMWLSAGPGASLPGSWIRPPVLPRCPGHRHSQRAPAGRCRGSGAVRSARRGAAGTCRPTAAVR
jgi:hypothetical protein